MIQKFRIQTQEVELFHPQSPWLPSLTEHQSILKSHVSEVPYQHHNNQIRKENIMIFIEYDYSRGKSNYNCLTDWLHTEQHHFQQKQPSAPWMITALGPQSVVGLNSLVNHMLHIFKQ